MKTFTEEVGICPHCEGKKLLETMTYEENSYPPSLQIMGPGGRSQMALKTKKTIYCSKCFTIFKK